MSNDLDLPCTTDTQLAAFLDGTLADDPRRALEDHLDTCGACRALVAHASAAKTEHTPRQVGRYRLEAELGRGGMGVVWRAWDPALEREVAVKVLHPELDDAVFRKRALREARALARLQHPNVIAVHDVGDADGEVFIATELIDGEPLDRWQRGKPASEILAAYAQAARGLAAAHTLGLVHRDVKPSNILVSRSGRVCVGDFGLAIWARQQPALLADSRPPNAPELPQLTHDGAIAGTPAYMAPEQRRGELVGAAADQYALCLALAEALLGYRPAVGAAAAALAASGVVAPWPAIARGLEVDASRRFPDLAPLIAALEGSEVAVLRPARRRRLRRPAAALGLGVLAVGVAASLLAQRPALARVPRPAEPASTFPVARGPITGDVSWQSPTDLRWRLPTAGERLALVSPKLALVTMASPRAAHQLMTVNLETGQTAGPFPVVDEPGAIHQVIEVEGRWLAIGAIDDEEAVWELSLEPLAAKRISWTGPGKDVFAAAGLSWLKSPGGTRLAVCRRSGPVTVHDPRTFRLLRRFPEHPCYSMYFRDEQTLVAGDKQHDLRTGAISPVVDDRGVGPNGATLRPSPDRFGYDVVRRGKVVQTGVPGHLSSMRWTPDGAAIGMDLSSVGLRPAGDGSTRTLRLTLPTPDDFAVDELRAVMLSGPVLEVVHLTTGARELPTGPLSPIHAVAPYGGAIAAASDRLRLQRRDEVLAQEDAEMTELAQSSSANPLLMVERYRGVWQWDPRSDQRVQLGNGDEDAVGPLASDGASAWFVVGSTITRWRRGEKPAPILRTYEVDIAGLDARGLVWIDRRGDLALVDLRKRVAYQWKSESRCFGDDEVSTTGDWSAIRRFGRIEVVDVRSAQVAGALEVTTEARAAALPSGELVVATGAELWLWKPGQAELLAFPTGAPPGATPTALAVSRDGSELAVGYDSGVVAYASTRAVRARGKRQPATAAESCFGEPAAAARPLDEVASELGLELLPDAPRAPR